MVFQCVFERIWSVFNSLYESVPTMVFQIKRKTVNFWPFKNHFVSITIHTNLIKHELFHELFQATNFQYEIWHLHIIIAPFLMVSCGFITILLILYCMGVMRLNWEIILKKIWKEYNKQHNNQKRTKNINKNYTNMKGGLTSDSIRILYYISTTILI